MAKLKTARRKTAGSFYVAKNGSGQYGDLVASRKKPQSYETTEQYDQWDSKTETYKDVHVQVTDYSDDGEFVCSSGFADITGREVKPGECWRVDFKLTRVDRAAVAARAKRAKQAKRK